MPRSPDDRPLTVAQLAAEAGISESTLRGWASRRDRPLARVDGPRQRHTWAQLRAFCEEHRTLYKAGAVLQRQPVAAVRPSSGGLAGSVVDVRALADAHLNAIVAAVRAAEAAARAHREHLESLIGAYDEVVAAIDAAPPDAG